jgi:hypothetical protein
VKTTVAIVLLMLSAVSAAEGQDLVFSGPNCANPSTGVSGACGAPVNINQTYASVYADYGAIPNGSNIRLSDLFAAANAPVEVLDAQVGALYNQTSALQAQVGAIYDQIDALQKQQQRLYEGIALTSALTILPPNPGDRFSVTFGGSGFNGYGAGAITATARLSSNIIGFAGYARSQSEISDEPQATRPAAVWLLGDGSVVGKDGASFAPARCPASDHHLPVLFVDVAAVRVALPEPITKDVPVAPADPNEVPICVFGGAPNTFTSAAR